MKWREVEGSKPAVGQKVRVAFYDEKTDVGEIQEGRSIMGRDLDKGAVAWHHLECSNCESRAILKLNLDESYDYICRDCGKLFLEDAFPDPPKKQALPDCLPGAGWEKLRENEYAKDLTYGDLNVDRRDGWRCALNFKITGAEGRIFLSSTGHDDPLEAYSAVMNKADQAFNTTINEL